MNKRDSRIILFKYLIRSSFHSKIYNIEDSLAILLAPMLSWIADTRFFITILYVFCKQFEIPIDLVSILNISPTENTLKNILNNNTAEM